MKTWIWKITALLMVLSLAAGVAAQDEEPEADPAADKPAAEKPAEKKDPAAEGEARKPMNLPSGGTLYLEEKKIEMDGKVVMNRGLVELFACAEGGQDHESVLLLDVDPAELNLALIMLGLRDGRPATGLGDDELSTGDRVIMEVYFTDEEGEEKKLRAEELVWVKGADKPLQQVGFVYVGSAFKDEIDPDTGEPTGRRLFLASLAKSLIAVGDDPANPPTILDNPLPWSANDSLYYVNEKVIPPINTDVRAVIRVPTDEELAELKALEKKIIEEARAEGMPDVDAPGLPGKGGIDEDPQTWDEEKPDGPVEDKDDGGESKKSDEGPEKE